MLPPMMTAPLSKDLGAKTIEGASYPNVKARPVNDPMIATKIESITSVGSYIIDICESLNVADFVCRLTYVTKCGSLQKNETVATICNKKNAVLLDLGKAAFY